MRMNRVNRVLSGLANFAAALPNLIAGERHYARIVRALDRNAIRAIIRRFAAEPGFRDGRKYLRLRWYLRDSVARAVALGLHRHDSIRVLDLGSGAGYFLLACRHFGHEVMGFDKPANRFYEAMFRHFRLPRVEGQISPLQRIQGLDGQFDLITAFAVTFANTGRNGKLDYWGKEEWSYFFADMRARLRPGGRLFLRLNIAHMRGLLDRGRFSYLHEPVAGFQVRIFNRREVCLTAA